MEQNHPHNHPHAPASEPSSAPSGAPMSPAKSPYLVPVSILLAGILIAGAVIFSNHSSASPVAATTQTSSSSTSTQQTINSLPVTSADHILGSPTAKVVIVEYSDLECPFCKVFQGELQQVMSAYGKAGTVAWVYRQFPLYKPDSNGNALHPKAGKEAEASECANQLGGPTAFWKYIDEIFNITPSNNGLDPAELPKVAGDIGLDVTAFNQCLSSGKYAQFVSDSFDNAIKAGGTGTPYIVLQLQTKLSAQAEALVVSNMAAAFQQIQPGVNLPDGLITFDPSGLKLSFDGALPYPIVTSILDTIIAQK